MATVFKIHPAIGIARVGNSPDEIFVGPERLGQRPNPAGRFKDAQCRVKRQAARFRIFAHHDDGSVEEITNAEADITWTVHLVNKKAANPGRGNSESAADLTIDPGSKTLTGPDQRQLFDTGQIHFAGNSQVTVPLGEIRSDNENHLLVLGGFGTSASPVGSGLSTFWKPLANSAATVLDIVAQLTPSTTASSEIEMGPRSRTALSAVNRSRVSSRGNLVCFSAREIFDSAIAAVQDGGVLCLLEPV
jgi:hypothetical protein